MNAVDEVGEYSLGLYAACLQKEAVIAISGTGSGVFYVREKAAGYGVGGWGALISDEGSGYYLGRLAALAAIRSYEKRFSAFTAGTPRYAALPRYLMW